MVPTNLDLLDLRIEAATALLEYRKALGLSQAMFAVLVGKKQDQVCAWEALALGKPSAKNPSLDLLTTVLLTCNFTVTFTKGSVKPCEKRLTQLRSGCGYE